MVRGDVRRIEEKSVAKLSEMGISELRLAKCGLKDDWCASVGLVYITRPPVVNTKK